MTQVIILDIDLDDADPNGIFLVAAIGGAGAITMDGALVSGGIATMDFARQIGIISAGNDSGITFTIVGTDQDNKDLTEVITGGNIATVESSDYFKTIESITASGASAGNVTIGTVDEVSSQSVPLRSKSGLGATININVTGTINFSVQERFDNIQLTNLAIQNANWQDVSALNAKTADTTASISAGATAARIIVNSHSSAAELQMYINQPPYRA